MASRVLPHHIKKSLWLTAPTQSTKRLRKRLPFRLSYNGNNYEWTELTKVSAALKATGSRRGHLVSSSIGARRTRNGFVSGPTPPIGAFKCTGSAAISWNLQRCLGTVVAQRRSQISPPITLRGRTRLFGVKVRPTVSKAEVLRPHHGNKLLVFLSRSEGTKALW